MDEECNSMAEESNSEPMQQEKPENINLVYDYIVNKKYTPGLSKNDKSAVRKCSRFYVCRAGKLFYRHRKHRIGKSENAYVELLVIRDPDEQRRIIRGTHTGTGENDTGPSLERHLGHAKTLSKILERFYWKSVSLMVREFIYACEMCQKYQQPKVTDKIDKVFDYVVNNHLEYGMSKNDKGNLVRKSKDYYTQSGQLYYCPSDEKVGNPANEYRGLLVIRDRDEQRRIIENVHLGIGDIDTDPSLECHHGIDRTRSTVLDRFYWKNIGRDVREFIANCDCKPATPVRKMEVVAPQPVQSGEVMVQIGVYISNLSKTTDGYCCIVVAIDYFSKWPEARALKELSEENVAKFLFEDIICRHGCAKIQMNDLGKGFVNKVSLEVHRLTGTQQNITSGYDVIEHSEMEEQVRSIKDSFIRSFDDQDSNWVNLLSPILFAYRTSKHSSAKVTPFQTVYNRQPTLPHELQSSYELQKFQGSDQ